MGSGGMGTGGAPSCQQNETMACDTGLKGACSPGKATCNANGSSYGSCVPDVAPNAMPEDCTKVGDENCDGVACSDCVWSFLAGDGNNVFPTAVAIDASGNIFVTGGFTGTLKFLNKSNNTSVVLNSAGSSSTLLAKFNPSGEVLWAKAFGDIDSGAFTESLAIDAAGDVLIAGQSYGAADFGSGAFTALGAAAAYVAKFDATGVPQWSRQLGSSGNGNPTDATTVAVDSNGDVVLGGWLNGTMTIGAIKFPTALGYDVFVAKLAGPTGAVTWAKQFKEESGTTNVDQFLGSLTTDSSNNIFMTGFFSGTILLNTILSTIGGGADQDVFVAKLDPKGTPAWSVAFGTMSNDAPKDIAVDGSGNVLVTGTVGGSTNFGGGLVSISGNAIQNAFIVEYTNASAYVNAKIFPADSGVGLDTDEADDIYLSGVTTRLIDLGGGPLPYGGGKDMFLVKLDANLAHLWSKDFGDAKNQFSQALRYDTSSKSVILLGAVNGNIDFGTGSLTAVPMNGNLSLAKFQP